MVNKQRGFRRLAIALGVPWFGFWGLAGYLNYRAYWHFNELFEQDLTKGYDTNLPIWSQEVSSAMHWMSLSIWFGVIAPILALIATAVGYWVYRGFKPKT